MFGDTGHENQKSAEFEEIKSNKMYDYFSDYDVLNCMFAIGYSNLLVLSLIFFSEI